MLDFLNSGPARLATLFLVAQAALLYSSIRPENVPDAKPLSEFPQQLGAWQSVREGVVDEETREVLKADDLLNRVYANTSAGSAADLFIAAFRTQRNGKAPHSPKNCLPGNGWTPLVSGEYSIDVGVGEPITVNRYIISHGDDRSLVLYWYQSRDRVVASEYKAKFWVVMDAMRLNRTDTALVRIIVPIGDRDEDRALRTATDFVKAFYSSIRQNLPA